MICKTPCFTYCHAHGHAHCTDASCPMPQPLWMWSVRMVRAQRGGGIRAQRRATKPSGGASQTALRTDSNGALVDGAE